MDTPPPNTSRGSHCGRSRTPSYPLATIPHLHRVPTGRIARARSVSALQLSEQNRRAIWEAATGQTFRSRPSELVSESDVQLTGLVTPSLLHFAPPSTSAPSTSSFASLEALSSSESGVSTAASSTNSLVEVSLDPEGLKSSMEFMMPAQYGQFGSYPSSYQSSYMEQYSNPEQQPAMAQASPQPSSYAPSYTTSPPMMGSSPVTSQRSVSRERDRAQGQQYQQVVPPPYDPSGAQGNYGYSATPSSTSTLQYTGGYQSTQDAYGTNAYGVGYGQVPSSYLPSQGAYSAQYAVSNPAPQTVQMTTEDPSGVRVVTARPKPQCWEHGCNGRQFSTFSNLLRHQREKSGTATKSECPRCGAVFTRTTARNGHLAHDKCKRKSAASASEPER